MSSRAAFGILCLSRLCQPRNARHWNVEPNTLECRGVWAASINVPFQGQGQLCRLWHVLSFPSCHLPSPVFALFEKICLSMSTGRFGLPAQQGSGIPPELHLTLPGGLGHRSVGPTQKLWLVNTGCLSPDCTEIMNGLTCSHIVSSLSSCLPFSPCTFSKQCLCVFCCCIVPRKGV